MADDGGQQTQCRVFLDDKSEGIMVNERDVEKKKRGGMDPVLRFMEKARKEDREVQERIIQMQERALKVQENAINILGELAKAINK